MLDSPDPMQMNSERTRTGELIPSLCIVLGVALISVMRVIGDPNFFWHDDFQMQYLPGLREAARAFTEGSFPLLTTTSWHSTALAGELQYGVFSLFGMLVNLVAWSLQLSLPNTAMFLSAAHLAVAAVGAYLLARDFGISRGFAFIAALAGSHNGAVMVWGATDWYPVLTSIAWIPWFWLGLRRIERELVVTAAPSGHAAATAAAKGALRAATAEGSGRHISPLIGTAVAIYLVITAGWPFTMLMALVLAAWHIVPALVRRDGKATVRLIVACAIGAALAAPALLVHIEYLSATTRAATTTALQSWSVPLVAFIGAVFPTFRTTWNGWYSTTQHSVTELAGAFVPLVGFIAALILGRRDFVRKIKRELALLAFVTLLAMLPSVPPFRFSYRWLPLWHLVLLMIGLQGLDWLRAHRGESNTLRTNPGAWAAGIAVVAWILCSIFDQAWSLTRSYSSVIFLLAIVWSGIEGMPRAHLLASAFTAIVAFASVWLIFDWVPTNQDVAVWRFDDRELRSPQPYFPEDRTFALYRRADVFRADRSLARGSEGNALFRPANTPMFANLRFVNGYSPMLPVGMHDVLGFDYLGYVTDEAAARLLVVETQRGALFEHMGVDAIVVHESLLERVPREYLSDWHLAAKDGDEYLLRRATRTGAPVHAATALRMIGDEREALTEITRRRNWDLPVILTGYGTSTTGLMRPCSDVRIERAVEARLRSSAIVDTSRCASDALVYFTRPWLPGWRATVNGKRVDLLKADLLMPAIILQRGQRADVAIEYSPRSLWIGVAIAGAGLLALIAIAIFGRVERRPPPAAEENTLLAEMS